MSANSRRFRNRIDRSIVLNKDVNKIELSVPDSVTIEDAIWAGDVDLLNEIAPCHYCCFEHTFQEGCPAWAWAGCRGYGSVTRDEYDSWRRHYITAHGIDLNTGEKCVP